MTIDEALNILEPKLLFPPEFNEAISVVKEELKRWHTDRINTKIKNVFANTSTLICHNCDHKDEYIEELEAELEEYRAIGTLDECRAAVEKQKAKKVKDVSMVRDNEGYKCTDNEFQRGAKAGAHYVLNRAIEIVKGGGVNG